MATFRDIKRLLTVKVQNVEPSVTIDRSTVFFVPVGYYLRGFWIQFSKWNSDAFMVHEGVVPLFGSPSGYGRSNRLRTEKDRDSWIIGDIDDLAEVIKDQLAPNLGIIKSGDQYLHFLRTWYRDKYGLYPPIDAGLAELHRENLKDAKVQFNTYLDGYRRAGATINPTPVFHEIENLVQLIDTNPKAIPAHCEAVARKALAARKLEKYWSAGPFWP